ncbi:MAG: orotate phosphoribosyltransferase [Cyclobacteriaceae bacterium]
MGFEHSQPEIAEKIAHHLLDIKAIKLNQQIPFQWASGWKSPIYCDNRLTLSYPAIRSLVKKYLVDEIRRCYPGCEAIAGVATAGIPQGALVADEMELPFLYVRSKPKGHGMENLIEGRVDAGAKVVVIEDLVSTGGSSLKAVEALRKEGVEVMGMAAIFTYGFQKAEDNFEAADVNLICISNYDALLRQALKSGYVQEADIPLLEKWKADPAGWGQ